MEVPDRGSPDTTTIGLPYRMRLVIVSVIRMTVKVFTVAPLAT
jgi:hypothetical protein